MNPSYDFARLGKEHEALLAEDKEHWDISSSKVSLERNFLASGAPQRYHQCPTRRYWPIWLHLSFLAAYTVVFLGAFVFSQLWIWDRGQCATFSAATHFESLTKNDPLRDAFRYSRRVVDYNFESETPFKGSSLDKVEEAWQDLINHPHELRLNEYEVNLGNISTIQLSDGSGDYIVQPQAYHMFHCLYNIYKYAHPDFYGTDPGGPEWIKTHTDHCVDNLRQFVQCHAGGTGVATYKWISGRKIPWPVLSAEEVCIDWGHFDGWVQERSVKLDDLRSMGEKNLLINPEMGVVEYDDFLKAMVHSDE